jgi:hypothetical protein
MKVQFTQEELAQALTEYARTYKGIEISEVYLGCNFADDYDPPEIEEIYATADFKIIPQ